MKRKISDSNSAHCIRPLNVVFWIILIFSPVILLAVIGLISKQNVFCFHPLWSDEIDYWIISKNTSAHGLDIGYTGYYEVTGSFGKLGGHGITSLILYGLFSLFGWGSNSILICNTLWMVFSFIVFVVIAKPDVFTSILLSVSYFMFSGILLYAASSMTETANYALVVLFVSLCIYYQKQKNNSNRLLLVFLIIIMACVRFTYIILLFSFLFRKDDNGKLKKKRALLFLIMICICFVTAKAFTDHFTSPYVVTRGIDYDSYTIFQKADMVLQRTATNIRYYVIPTGSIGEKTFRISYLLTLCSCVFFSFFDIRNNGLIPKIIKKETVDYTFLSLSAVLFIFLSANILGYNCNDYRDFRLLSPILWGCFFYLIYCHHTHMIKEICALLLFSAVGAVLSYSFWDSNALRIGGLSTDVSDLASLVEYTEDADSPWDNTIAIDDYSFAFISNLAPGIGIQYYQGFSDNCVKNSKFIYQKYTEYSFEGYDIIARNGSGILLKKSE